LFVPGIGMNAGREDFLLVDVEKKKESRIDEDRF